MQKTIILTGGTSGIGLATLKELATLNQTVIVLSRNTKENHLIVESVIKKSNNNNITFFPTDLASKDEIINSVETIEKKFQQVDVLINNAGYVSSSHHLTKDQYEQQLMVNHFAPLLLSLHLLPLLQKSTQGRIINVTSRAHARGRIWWDDINLIQKYSGSKSYNQSKLANLMTSYKLAELLKETTITVNSFHPGLVNTSIGNKHHKWYESFAWSIIKQLGANPSSACQDAVYLALDEDVAYKTGGYYHQRKKIKSSKYSYNKKNIDRIWNLSCQLLGVDENIEQYLVDKN